MGRGGEAPAWDAPGSAVVARTGAYKGLGMLGCRRTAHCWRSRLKLPCQALGSRAQLARATFMAKQHQSLQNTGHAEKEGEAGRSALTGGGEQGRGCMQPGRAIEQGGEGHSLCIRASYTLSAGDPTGEE